MASHRVDWVPAGGVGAHGSMTDKRQATLTSTTSSPFPSELIINQFFMSSTSTVRTQTNTHRGGTPFRGGYSPRRGGFGYGVPYRGRASPFRSRPSRTNIPGRDILEGLVPMPQKTIYRDHYIHSSDIVLEDLQYLGSYNWLEADEPSIVVPGTHIA